MATGVPYSVWLDPDVAQQLAEQGGALLILDLPEGSYFGIDHMAFHCGPRFRGVKMLPPGPHFVCYSVPGSHRHGGGMGPITGFFFNVATGTGSSGKSGATKYGSVLVRRYDAAQELLVELPQEEAERYAHGVRQYEFDWGLAPYNLNAWRQWRELTTCLDARVIDAVQPVGGNICTAMEASPDDDDDDEGGDQEQGCAWGAEGGRPAAPTDAELRLKRQLQEGRAARAARAAASSSSGAAAAAAAAPPGGHQGPTLLAVAAGDATMEAAAAAAQAEAARGGDSAVSMEVEEAAAGGDVAAAVRPAGGGGAAGTAAGSSTAGAGRSSGGSSGRCFYSPLPRLVKKAGLNPSQLTALNLDRTRQLEALAAERYGGSVEAVVGEAQFAFIAFVFGQSLQGFRQWRSLVTLFLNCESGPLGARAPAFAAFTAALRAQLALGLADSGEAAADGSGGPMAAGVMTQGSSLIEEVLLAGGGRDCFLRHHLGTFFEVLREAEEGLDARLRAEASELRAVLSRMVGWQFDGLQVLGEDDDDEYAPVVVELEEGMAGA